MHKEQRQRLARDGPVRAALECICVEVAVCRQFKTNSFLIPLGAFVRASVQDCRDENAGRTDLNSPAVLT